MGSFGRSFAIVVIVLDIIAVVFFAGNYITTGHILSHHDKNAHDLATLLIPTTGDSAAAVVASAEAALPAAPLVGNAAQGASTVGKCKACHTFTPGGKNMIGPNLFGIFGSKMMHVDGFAYSTAFAAKQGEVWSEENLNQFLTNPKTFVPGTKMAFPGLKNAQDRADVLAYLKSLK